jgi:hypothetical protein
MWHVGMKGAGIWFRFCWFLKVSKGVNLFWCCEVRVIFWDTVHLLWILCANAWAKMARFVFCQPSLATCACYCAFQVHPRSTNVLMCWTLIKIAFQVMVNFFKILSCNDWILHLHDEAITFRRAFDESYWFWIIWFKSWEGTSSPPLAPVIQAIGKDEQDGGLFTFL